MLLKVLLLVVLISLSCPGGSAKAVPGSHLVKQRDVPEKVLDNESDNLEQSVWYQKQTAAIFTRMGRDRSVYGKAQASITDCVTLMAKSGVKGAFSKCKIHIQKAMKFCKGAAAKKTHKTACANMLVSIGIAVDECELQAEKHKKPSELCLTIVPKKKSKADCKAGQLFGQVPGNSTEPVCINAPLDKRSKTQPLPFRLYKHWPEEANSQLATEQNAIDVVVNTLPIGQGDCNIITCNSGKNVIIFDCGSSGGNRVEPKFIMDYFKFAELVTVLVSHGHNDHLSYIKDILSSLNSNVKVQALLGGPESDYKSDFLKALRGASVTKDLGVASFDFCNNPDIHFNFLRSSPSYGNPNQRGMLMKLSCSTCLSSLLFTGDMEGQAAKDIATNINNAVFLKCTHYKMAHHGASAIANEEEWLKAIMPVEVHISHKYNGRYHHPRCAAMNRLRDYCGIGTTVGATGALPHNFACFGEKEENYKAYESSITSRVFSTAPRENEACLIKLSFHQSHEAVTEYFCKTYT